MADEQKELVPEVNLRLHHIFPKLSLCPSQNSDV